MLNRTLTRRGFLQSSVVAGVGLAVTACQVPMIQPAKPFDYIIIGAGSAGCVLANRLSAQPDATVLVLEAGGPDTDPLIHEPTAWPAMIASPLDWGYLTTPQAHTADRVHLWSRKAS